VECLYLYPLSTIDIPSDNLRSDELHHLTQLNMSHIASSSPSPVLHINSSAYTTIGKGPKGSRRYSPFSPGRLGFVYGVAFGVLSGVLTPLVSLYWQLKPRASIYDSCFKRARRAYVLGQRLSNYKESMCLFIFRCGNRQE